MMSTIYVGWQLHELSPDGPGLVQVGGGMRTYFGSARGWPGRTSSCSLVGFCPSELSGLEPLILGRLQCRPHVAHAQGPRIAAHLDPRDPDTPDQALRAINDYFMGCHGGTGLSI